MKWFSLMSTYIYKHAKEIVKLATWNWSFRCVSSWKTFKNIFVKIELSWSRKKPYKAARTSPWNSFLLASRSVSFSIEIWVKKISPGLQWVELQLQLFFKKRKLGFTTPKIRAYFSKWSIFIQDNFCEKSSKPTIEVICDQHWLGVNHIW